MRSSTTTQQIAAMQDTPVNPTLGGSGVPARVWAAAVTVVNPDGTVDVQPFGSRATKVSVPVAVGVLPTVGDLVMVVDLAGDPQRPIVLASVEAAAIPGPVGAAGGDLAGTYPDPRVGGLAGSPLPAVASGQGYVWNGAGWSAQSQVSSFNGRTGAVTPESGDYAISQITYPTYISFTGVACTAAWGSGAAVQCRKLPDGTVEFAQNLYCTGQPSASAIQVSSGFPPAFVPGDTYNSGWALANYDDTWPYVAYFPNSAPYELWIRTQDGSSRTEWNPIFNSLRYSTIPG